MDEELFRNVFSIDQYKAHSKTSLEIFYLETGSIPIMYILTSRRLNFLWYLIHQQEDSLLMVKRCYVCRGHNARVCFPTNQRMLQKWSWCQRRNIEAAIFAAIYIIRFWGLKPSQTTFTVWKQNFSVFVYSCLVTPEGNLQPFTTKFGGPPLTPAASIFLIWHVWKEF